MRNLSIFLSPAAQLQADNAYYYKQSVNYFKRAETFGEKHRPYNKNPFNKIAPP